MEQNAIKLNAQNLYLLSKKVKIPSYDRSKVKTGIVHVGIGGFIGQSSILHKSVIRKLWSK